MRTPADPKAVIYARMSTGHQEFSIENQIALLNQYAKEHHILVIDAYIDKGISGLTFDARPALKNLLDTVLSGTAEFSIILVLDVSRWGRFQDIDESAYYEYACKRAGISVHYVSEQFQNDNTSLSSIVKAIKRVMAAEYSRELSKKVHFGKLRLGKQGYRQGGAAGYGLRRAVVDEKGKIKTVLDHNARKSFPTDRIILVPGPENEKIIVNRIYHYFTHKNYTMTKIARLLNNQNIPAYRGKKWTKQLVHGILANEKYIGNHVTGKHLWNFGRRKKEKTPPHSWVRVDGAFEAIVPEALYRKAEKKLSCRRRKFYSKEELLDYLAKFRREVGELSSKKLNKAKDYPSVYLFRREFGSLRAAYGALGYRPPHGRPSALGRQISQATLKAVSQLGTHIENFELQTRAIPGSGRLFISVGSLTLYVVPCRSFPAKADRRLYWAVSINNKWPYDYALIIRMDEENRKPKRYYLIPFHEIPEREIRFWSQRRGWVMEQHGYSDMQEIKTALLARLEERALLAGCASCA